MPLKTSDLYSSRWQSSGAEPRLDAILVRSDLCAASVTRIETLGFHHLSAPHPQKSHKTPRTLSLER